MDIEGEYEKPGLQHLKCKRTTTRGNRAYIIKYIVLKQQKL